MAKSTVIMVVAHAPLASALKSVAEHVFGGTTAVTAIDVLPGACAADSTDALVDRITSLDAGAGVLLMTDLPGASPSNICIEACHRARSKGTRCEVVCGVNAAMVLRAVTYREHDLVSTADHALKGAAQTLLRVD